MVSDVVAVGEVHPLPFLDNDNMRGKLFIDLVNDSVNIWYSLRLRRKTDYRICNRSALLIYDLQDLSLNRQDKQ